MYWIVREVKRGRVAGEEGGGPRLGEGAVDREDELLGVAGDRRRDVPLDADAQGDAVAVDDGDDRVIAGGGPRGACEQGLDVLGCEDHLRVRSRVDGHAPRGKQGARFQPLDAREGNFAADSRAFAALAITAVVTEIEQAHRVLTPWETARDAASVPIDCPRPNFRPWPRR